MKKLLRHDTAPQKWGASAASGVSSCVEAGAGRPDRPPSPFLHSPQLPVPRISSLLWACFALRFCRFSRATPATRFHFTCPLRPNFRHPTWWPRVPAQRGKICTHFSFVMTRESHSKVLRVCGRPGVWGCKGAAAAASSGGVRWRKMKLVFHTRPLCGTDGNAAVAVIVVRSSHGPSLAPAHPPVLKNGHIFLSPPIFPIPAATAAAAVAAEPSPCSAYRFPFVWPARSGKEKKPQALSERGPTAEAVHPHTSNRVPRSTLQPLRHWPSLNANFQRQSNKEIFCWSYSYHGC